MTLCLDGGMDLNNLCVIDSTYVEHVVYINF